jgi:uncharacterized protein YyaL (SSP411 family)
MPRLRAIRVAVCSGLLLAGCSRPSSNRPPSGVTVETVNGAVRYTNRLIAENSPYLQQHAHNPVDWYPWGAEAFAKAAREDKAIFLSIGYAACHWCHVMEAESFANPAIADLMNQSFVSIKVDREERPDLDRVYLAYVNSVNGGGWPMSLFLTADLKPFFGATYLPPETRDGQEGFRHILQRIATAWRTDRAAIEKAATDGTTTVAGLATLPQPAALSNLRAIDETYASLAGSFDREAGGFAGAPKFPRPAVLTFLLSYYARTREPAARDMTLATLRAIANGGIHDQLGGGFHRYTVDGGWRQPHFEKMLYDQAQLIAAYATGFQATKEPWLSDVAHRTADYVLRELTDPSGGFYSAQDADSATSRSNGRLEEGAFYRWTSDDLRRAAGADADLASYYFDVGEDDGNREAEPGTARGTTLATPHSIRETAVRFALAEATVASRIERLRERLVTERRRRPSPAQDRKIITGWNGLMISALARASQILNEPRYLTAAETAARFVEQHLFDRATASLKRRFYDGSVDVDGLLEDYAYLVQGLLDLYEASFSPQWLALAHQLQETQDRLFWDAAHGAYFSTQADASHVLTRAKEDYDGAEPAANSVAVMNLLRLWQLTGADVWRTRAGATIQALSGRIARSGSAVPQLMAALEFLEATPKQIVIAGDPAAQDTGVLLRLVHDRFIPSKILVLVDGGMRQRSLLALAPELAEMERRDGRATIYVCQHYACRLPTSDPATAARLLDER